MRSLIAFLVLSFGCLLPGFAEEITQERSPSPIFRLSPETTVIESPLDNRGLPDYRAHLNRVLSDGVNNDNNAFILYWRAMGDSLVGEEVRKEYEACLGAVLFDPTVVPFVTLGQYARDVNARGDDAVDNLFAQKTEAASRPWTPDQFPTIAAWIQRNEPPLGIAVEATRREKYFHPVAGKEGELLLESRSPGWIGQRELADALAVRAMLRLGRKDVFSAKEDALAIHRMSRHVAQGWCFMDLLTAVSIETKADRCDQHIALSGLLTAEELTAYRLELSELGDIDRYQSMLAMGERFTLLDAMISLTQLPESGERGIASIEVLSDPNQSPLGRRIRNWLLQHVLDWGTALEIMNQFIDRLSESARYKTHRTRQLGFNLIFSEYAAVRSELRQPIEIVRLILLGSEQRGRSFGRLMSLVLAPDVGGAENAQQRSNVQRQVTQAGFAVCAFRSSNGRLPTSLAELVPDYLDRVPEDGYYVDELRYLKRGSEFVVYSIGKNSRDDGGLTYNENWAIRSDDLVFRTPGWFTPPAEQK